MSINLIEKVQQSLGYAPLQKIDPNVQQLNNDPVSPKDKFAQAATPAVLTALYKFVQSDNGAGVVLSGDSTTDWRALIFDDHKPEILEKLSEFANKPSNEVAAEINVIANEAVSLAKQELPDQATIKEVKQFFSNQRNNILTYLPAALHMGELLHDNTLDDKTNKMEGPISSLIKSIGSAFSNPVTEDEVKNND